MIKKLIICSILIIILSGCIERNDDDKIVVRGIIVSLEESNWDNCMYIQIDNTSYLIKYTTLPSTITFNKEIELVLIPCSGKADYFEIDEYRYMR